MEVVWEVDIGDSTGQKRARKACTVCQRKKKKCSHVFVNNSNIQQDHETNGLNRVLPALVQKPEFSLCGDLQGLSGKVPSESGPSDLAKQLFGEAAIEAAKEQSANRSRNHANWPQGSASTMAKPPRNVQKYSTIGGGRRTLSFHHRSYLMEVGAFRVLPKSLQDAMVIAFLTWINPLLPILDSQRLRTNYESNSVSIFLLQAIALVTCKMPSVSNILRFEDNGPLVNPIDFARSLHIGLDAAMKADLAWERLEHTQILVLMHLHNDGPGGLELSSTNLSNAIQIAWTIGLHCNLPGRSPDDSQSLLWWTIWVLDRFNACIVGRPVMIADRDNNIPKPPSQPAKMLSGIDSWTNLGEFSAINVWIHLGELLDKVLDLYRPGNDQYKSNWSGDFPTWESISSDVELNTLHKAQEMVLELCYHVIAVLSSRKATTSHPSYSRSTDAADKIDSLLTTHLPTPDTVSLAPESIMYYSLPLIPYAASLSLTVAFRDFQSYRETEGLLSKVITRFKTLERLQQYWWTAGVALNLARRRLRHLNLSKVRKEEIADVEALLNSGDKTAIPHPQSTSKSRTSFVPIAPAMDATEQIHNQDSTRSMEVSDTNQPTKRQQDSKATKESPEQSRKRVTSQEVQTPTVQSGSPSVRDHSVDVLEHEDSSKKNSSLESPTSDSLQNTGAMPDMDLVDSRNYDFDQFFNFQDSTFTFQGGVGDEPGDLNWFNSLGQWQIWGFSDYE